MIGPLLEQLRAIVGPQHLLTDPDVRAGYERDWTGRFLGRTPAVVRPATTKEVAEVVAACAASGVALVPQGGNTGLVGGSVPLQGEILLSLRRLRRLDPVDEVLGNVVAGAGITLAELAAHAVGAGLRFGVDLGARDSATIGGMVATNAGGLRFVRHGGMRQQVVGIEAVLGGGAVVSRLDAPPKDNVGYDLAGLLCGSEGTLGIVTTARLRLKAPPGEVQTALLGVPDLAAAPGDRGRASTKRRAHGGGGGVLRRRPRAGTRPHRPVAPGPTGAGLPAGGVGRRARGPGRDRRHRHRFRSSSPRREARTRPAAGAYREAHTETVNALGIPHKLDVAVDPRRLDELAAAVRLEAGRAGVPADRRPVRHVADGNLHVNIVGPAPDDERLDDRIAAIVAGMGGSISAEHGIGTAKRRWLSLGRSPAELAAYGALRRALDPAGIMNPNAGP